MTGQSKLSSNGDQVSQANSPRATASPPIPFEKPEPKTLEKGQYQSFKCKNDPNKADSMTYQVDIPIFSSGTPEEWIEFKTNLNDVFRGQNLQEGQSRFNVVRRLLRGSAKTTFLVEEKKFEGKTLTKKALDQCLNAVANGIFHKGAYRAQRDYIRFNTKKPLKTKAIEWIDRVLELNSLLEKFPDPSDDKKAEKIPWMNSWEVSSMDYRLLGRITCFSKALTSLLVRSGNSRSSANALNALKRIPRTRTNLTKRSVKRKTALPIRRRRRANLAKTAYCTEKTADTKQTSVAHCNSRQRTCVTGMTRSIQVKNANTRINKN